MLVLRTQTCDITQYLAKSGRIDASSPALVGVATEMKSKSACSTTSSRLKVARSLLLERSASSTPGSLLRKVFELMLSTYAGKTSAENIPTSLLELKGGAQTKTPQADETSAFS